MIAFERVRVDSRANEAEKVIKIKGTLFIEHEIKVPAELLKGHQQFKTSSIANKKLWKLFADDLYGELLQDLQALMHYTSSINRETVAPKVPALQDKIQQMISKIRDTGP